jgi:hypothetical protein
MPGTLQGYFPLVIDYSFGFYKLTEFTPSLSSLRSFESNVLTITVRTYCYENQ